jgi:hypothetical protein
LVHQTLTDPSSGQCGALFPVAANPRLVAGESLSMTALKCDLRPVRFSSYPVTFTADQKQQLREAFPSGVCDYGRPGAGYRRPIASWLSYGDQADSTTPPTPLPPPVGS